MKFTVTFKTPDATTYAKAACRAEAERIWANEHGDTPPDKEVIEEHTQSLLSKLERELACYIAFGEIIRVIFDTDGLPPNIYKVK